jgi:hypothetical protein
LLGLRWERRLFIEPRDGAYVRGQLVGVAGAAVGLGEGASQSIQRVEGGYDVNYGFLNFDRTPLRIHLVLDNEAVADEYRNYGYTQEDLNRIQAWRQQALDMEYNKIVSHGGGQAEVDRAASILTQQYHQKVNNYLASRKFKFADAKTVEVDVPAVVFQSQAALRPVARIFQKIGDEHGYDDATTVSAVTAMVQTAIRYQDPGDMEGKRHIGGFLPPLNVLSRGYGDCDTKTGTIASILTNWSNVRMIGVALPEHYLGGILRIPQKGDAMIEYHGLNFVLIEPAGPAWLPPGAIGSSTLAMLEAHQDVQLEPFFKLE